MTLRHYQIFCEVAKTKNFTKAAENLFITQSAVSYAMKELEEEAGTRLFERLHKSVRLTSSGELLLQHLLPVVSECEKLDWQIRHLEEDAPIQIVSCITIAQTILPGLLNRFHELCPATPVKVEVMRASDAAQLLQKGGCELALLEGDPLNGAYQMKKFHEYSLVALAAKQKQIPHELSLKELLEHKLLLREKGSAVRDVFEGMLVVHGYTCSPIWTSVDSQTLLEAAAHGLGITILPKEIASEALAKGIVQQVVIKDSTLTNQAIAVMRKDTIMTRPLELLWKLLD